MQNVTDILSDEHRNIMGVIELILNECEEIEKGKALDAAFFEQAIDFIKNYADKFHHAKEEDILFKAMLENEDCMHCNPVPVMLHEHEEGRDFVRGMEDGLSGSDKEKVIENARGYSFLLMDHIYKEDHILYPMAEQAIPEEEKEKILLQYDAVLKEHNTGGRISSYLSLLARA
ncbi:hemerythrin domain-containing protein [Saccharicrinis sp. FJH62]|uniref:hemerythrin domain-containing protein n=1 Tax=Saccharicrinis sp. FJH62 TaxID=3344657 RepID=UPI0035D443A8